MATQASRCTREGCHGLIYWLRHVDTDKPAPIDVVPTPDGNVAVQLDWGKYRIIKKGEEYPYDRHTNHWQTCKNPPPKK